MKNNISQIITNAPNFSELSSRQSSCLGYSHDGSMSVEDLDEEKTKFISRSANAQIMNTNEIVFNKNQQEFVLNNGLAVADQIKIITDTPVGVFGYRFSFKMKDKNFNPPSIVMRMRRYGYPLNTSLLPDGSSTVIVNEDRVRLTLKRGCDTCYCDLFPSFIYKGFSGKNTQVIKVNQQQFMYSQSKASGLIVAPETFQGTVGASSYTVTGTDIGVGIYSGTFFIGGATITYSSGAPETLADAIINIVALVNGLGFVTSVAGPTSFTVVSNSYEDIFVDSSLFKDFGGLNVPFTNSAPFTSSIDQTVFGFGSSPVRYFFSDDDLSMFIMEVSMLNKSTPYGLEIASFLS